MRGRSALHVIEAYGLGNPWVLWRIARGDLDDRCSTCGGRAVVVTSPCGCREPGVGCSGCTLLLGCRHCRRACRECPPPPRLFAEDFGDAESLALARRVFPGIEVDEQWERIGMGARPGGQS